MAVYNPEPELFKQAVCSVLEQTMPVVELVLVNDGGGEEFRSVVPEDSRIRVYSKSNGGVSDARNFALERCRGEYIAFLDQDDFWYPDKLAEQVGVISRKGEPCMVVSPVDVVDAAGRRLEKASLRVLKKYLSGLSGNDVRQALADDNFIHSSSPLVHREVFSAVGGFDDATCPHDDWDLYLRIALAGLPVYGYTQKPLSVWRAHEGNESHKRMGMMLSKCTVEQKALCLGVSKEIESILRSNLVLDQVVIANLLYNEQDFRGFRESVRLYLPELVGRYINTGRTDRFIIDYKRRSQKTIMKSLRRYLLSFFR
ncbi:MAG: glycosyltransferase [Chlorobiaceae bacterium]|nr:glycosyltransferase [Chlorobiaceae bacterium]